MDKMSRIQIGNQMLSNLYDVYQHLSDEELSDFFYSFLVQDTSNDALTQTACMNYNIQPKDLIIHKKDIILEVLVNGYGYLRYVSTFCKLPEEEQQIIDDLDSIPFSIPILIEYFRKPENESKMKSLLTDYFVYETQDIDFMDDCREYLYNEPTEFYDKLCRVIRYIEVADSLATICDEIAEKYSHLDDDDIYELMAEDEDLEDEEEEDEEIEEEESGTRLVEVEDDFEELDEGMDPYELKLQIYKAELEQKELANRVLEFLEGYYQDKFDVDDFVGYFMSYVYAFLLKARENKALTLEDEEMLRILSKKNLSFEMVVETFYASKEYIFNSVDLFTQEYFKRNGDIYSVREEYTGIYDTNMYQLLDPFYERPPVNRNTKLITNPIMNALEQILLDIKNNNPDDYIGEIWQLLRDPEVDKGIFERYGLDSKYIPNYQDLIMRLFARKYVESVNSKQIGSFPSNELELYRELVYPTENSQSIEILFDMGYYLFIPNYFSLKEKRLVEQKRNVCSLRKKNLLGNVVRIDPTCVSDSLYVKALNESELFPLLETNGPKIMITLLEKLSRIDSDIVIEFIKEVVYSDYYYAKREEEPDKISQTLIKRVEEDVETYLSEISQNKKLLEEMLQRYLDSESKEEFTLSYQEKLELSPKIKQKLYPNDIYGKG